MAVRQDKRFCGELAGNMKGNTSLANQGALFDLTVLSRIGFEVFLKDFFRKS